MINALNNEIRIIRTDSLPVKNLDDDIIYSIFAKLNNDKDLENCSLVCKTWQKNAKEALYTNNIFDENKWKRYIGKPGNVDGSPLPLLPIEFHKILKSPCPIWQGKTTGQTHILMLQPETIDGRPLTLNLVAELLRKFLKNKKGFNNSLSRIFKEHGNKPIGKSCWVLMPKKILPESREQSFILQTDMVRTLAENTLRSYKVPELLRAALCLLAMYCNRGIQFFKKDFTRCQEITYNNQITLGNFDEDGLKIHSNRLDLSLVGISPTWNLSLDAGRFTSQEITPV